ncbi:MAG: Rieske 2Fe-2S domain-containing protein [Verrucomicrobia bacterium]|nr:Rieske 2Fe-2S domain-containing protein [Leptolyngbya sp. ES-bin-22]
MTTPLKTPIASLSRLSDRRHFLKYLSGGTIASLVLGRFLPAQSLEASLEDLCSGFPYNSRCKDYLPGMSATNEQGQPLAVDRLLTSAQPGTRLAVKGLADPALAYLVITDGPRIAEYAISTTCTHLGCTVAWKADQNRFICPCHGSQYDNQGRVVQGPARRNLGLLTVVVKQNQVRLVGRAPAIDPRLQKTPN